MKLKKNTAIAISFAVGTMMFATTAFAEVNSKTGYDQLKDSSKFTAETLIEKSSSYTLDTSIVVKDNDKILNSLTSTQKVNVKDISSENTSTSVNGSEKKSYYSYSDKNSSIAFNSEDNTYFVTDYTKPIETPAMTNPFKEDTAADIEKIADALVGNLKDYVVIAQNADGSRELSGTLNEAQIPAIANALLSFQLKNGILYQGSELSEDMPQITKDIFVKEVKGHALLNKDGVIENILGTGIISGKDEQGNDHALTFEILLKITNINSTSVAKPDLTNKKVQRTEQNTNYKSATNADLYIGNYKSDIIIEKDGKFQKIGEKFVNITSIDEKGVTGNYTEKFKEGFDTYSSSAKSFDFKGTFQDPNNSYYGDMTSTNSSNKTYKGNFSLNLGTAQIYFSINNSNQSGQILFNDQYNKILE